MGGASIWHWVVVGVIVLLLFGRGKISDLMGDVAKGIKSFKKGMQDPERLPDARDDNGGQARREGAPQEQDRAPPRDA